MKQPLVISRQFYDCIAFDLDGTLLDTRRDMVAAVNRFLQRLGRPSVPSQALANSIHHGMPAMLGCGLTLTGEIPAVEAFEEMVRDFLSDYQQHSAVHTRPYADTHELLQQLAESGFVLAVCTNKSVAITQQLLEHFNLEHFFKVIVGGDSLPARKPDPLPLRWIARELNTRPSRVLLVGDSIIDAECAQAAGAGLIVMEHGYGAGDVTSGCVRMANFSTLRAQALVGLHEQ